jgi:predicted nucleotidyltransferase
MTKHGIDLATPAIRDFCRRWKIVDLSVFGSILRDDFGPESDVDFLVRFEECEQYGLFELLEMESELANIIGRRVEVVERTGVEKSANYIRKGHILGTAEPILG